MLQGSPTSMTTVDAAAPEYKPSRLLSATANDVPSDPLVRC